MTDDGRIRRRPLYWANALFTEADQSFNAACARALRESGIPVFLPQEAAVNSEQSPGAADIFRIDTAAILQSALLVACLDQETIDCGVACEIGIAFAFGIPVLGLYTDVRQFRRGAGQMYKNLYVIGAIEAHGTIFSSLAALKSHLEDIFSEPTAHDGTSRSILIAEHFSQVATAYSQFVNELESWYQPSWSPGAQVSTWVREAAANSVLEYGCGPGPVARQLLREQAGLKYLGFDISAEMVKAARSYHDRPTSAFTCDRDEVLSNPLFGAFDMALALFSLNDDVDKAAPMGLLAEGVRHGGMIHVLDLSDRDLPQLTELLRSCLARPAVCPDHRLSSRWARDTAVQFGLDLVEMRVEAPRISFPSAEALDAYLKMFGIYSGMDLPLGLRDTETSKTRMIVLQAMQAWVFPFVDQRVFLSCTLRKP